MVASGWRAGGFRQGVREETQVHGGSQVFQDNKAFPTREGSLMTSLEVPEDGTSRKQQLVAVRIKEIIQFVNSYRQRWAEFFDREPEMHQAREVVRDHIGDGNAAAREDCQHGGPVPISGGPFVSRSLIIVWVKTRRCEQAHL